MLTAQAKRRGRAPGRRVGQSQRRERALSCWGRSASASAPITCRPSSPRGAPGRGDRRALANRPRLLLADEPTGALDSVSTRKILDLLRGVRERHGTTVIVVSHDPIVSELADRTLRMVDGRLSAATG